MWARGEILAFTNPHKGFKKKQDQRSLVSRSLAIPAQNGDERRCAPRPELTSTATKGMEVIRKTLRDFGGLWIRALVLGVSQTSQRIVLTKHLKVQMCPSDLSLELWDL